MKKWTQEDLDPNGFLTNKQNLKKSWYKTTLIFMGCPLKKWNNRRGFAYLNKNKKLAWHDLDPMGLST